MSDILENLSYAYSGWADSDQIKQTLWEARTEIERLRKEKADILVAKEIVFAPPAIPESFVIQEIQKVNVALHADIARLQNALATADEMRRADEAEIERLRKKVTKYKAQMQVMSEWMQSGYELMGPQAWPVWDSFVDDRPEALEWFDRNGVPK